MIKIMDFWGNLQLFSVTYLVLVEKMRLACFCNVLECSRKKVTFTQYFTQTFNNSFNPTFEALNLKYIDMSESVWFV